MFLEKKERDQAPKRTKLVNKAKTSPRSSGVTVTERDKQAAFCTPDHLLTIDERIKKMLRSTEPQP